MNDITHEMQLLGTERYKAGRYGWREYSYYITGDKVEERTLTFDRRYWVITRYVGVTVEDRQAITSKVSVLAQGERKSGRGHDELHMLLRRYPSVTGYVDPDTVDDPTRKVMISSARNMPSTESWEWVFAPEDLNDYLPTYAPSIQ